MGAAIMFAHQNLCRHVLVKRLQSAEDRARPVPLTDPATERRKPSLCRVGTASARARTPFVYRDSLSCRIEGVASAHSYAQV
jgi:hypothetical protein